MKAIFLLLLSLSAFAGQERGGGNEVGLEFVAAGRRALEEASASGLLLPARADELRRLLESAHVLATGEVLTVPSAAGPQESVAVNEPATLTVRVNELRWQSIVDDRVKRAIALHELDSLAGEESTGRYPVSGAYLAQAGYEGAVEPALQKGAASLLPNLEVVYTEAYDVTCEMTNTYLDHHVKRPVTKAFHQNFRAEAMNWRDRYWGFMLVAHDPRPQTVNEKKVLLQLSRTNALPGHTINDVILQNEFQNFQYGGSGITTERASDVYDREYIDANNVRDRNESTGRQLDKTITLKVLPDGSQLQTSTYRGTGELENDWELLTSTSSCLYRPRPRKDWRIFTRPVLAAVDRFDAANERTLDARKRWTECEAANGSRGCEGLHQAYDESVAARTKLWDTLVGRDEAASLLRGKHASPVPVRPRPAPPRPAPHARPRPPRDDGRNDSGIPERQPPSDPQPGHGCGPHLVCPGGGAPCQVMIVC